MRALGPALSHRYGKHAHLAHAIAPQCTSVVLSITRRKECGRVMNNRVFSFLLFQEHALSLPMIHFLCEYIYIPLLPKSRCHTCHSPCRPACSIRWRRRSCVVCCLLSNPCNDQTFLLGTSNKTFIIVIEKLPRIYSHAFTIRIYALLTARASFPLHFVHSLWHVRCSVSRTAFRLLRCPMTHTLYCPSLFCTDECSNTSLSTTRLAKDNTTGQEVAIKDIGLVPSFSTTEWNEYSIAAMLDHQNIIKVLHR